MKSYNKLDVTNNDPKSMNILTVKFKCFWKIFSVPAYEHFNNEV